jgi:hypothetical protein
MDTLMRCCFCSPGTVCLKNELSVPRDDPVPKDNGDSPANQIAALWI